MSWVLITEYMTGPFAEIAKKMIEQQFSEIERSGNKVTVRPIYKATSDIRAAALPDMIYDRRSETVILGVGSLHPTITSLLFFIHQMYDKKTVELLEKDTYELIACAIRSNDDNSELGYLNNYGLFRSSMHRLPLLQAGDELELTAQEKMLFRGYKIRRLSPDMSADETYNAIIDRKLRS